MQRQASQQKENMDKVLVAFGKIQNKDASVNVVSYGSNKSKVEGNKGQESRKIPILPDLGNVELKDIYHHFAQRWKDQAN